MYIHLGQDYVVKSEDIIGIFDLDNASTEKSTRSFLSESENNELLISATTDIPRSFIVCEERMLDKSKKTVVYLSQLSSRTIKKRAEEKVYGSLED